MSTACPEQRSTPSAAPPRRRDVEAGTRPRRAGRLRAAIRRISSAVGAAHAAAVPF
ncbi:MAG TPA: hypothetical protein VEZ42_02535 [Pseudonocardia sp.]|nr:hypothetical protein [Pseudonocardia sp.]